MADSVITFPGMEPVEFRDVARFMLMNPFARELTEQANSTLGYSLFDEYELSTDTYSEPAQVAFLVNCLALAYCSGQEPMACTGANFGTKAAAVYSGAIGFREAVRITAEMARYERQFFEMLHPDLVTLSLARTARPELHAILRDLDDWYEISCEVDDDLHMVTLREAWIPWLEQQIHAKGGVLLNIMRPPLRASVFEELRSAVDRDVLGTTRFTDPTVPVIADHDGTVLRTGEHVRGLLLNGCVRSVSWPAVVDSLLEMGVSNLYMCGPDRIFGRVRRVRESFAVVQADPRTA